MGYCIQLLSAAHSFNNVQHYFSGWISFQKKNEHLKLQPAMVKSNLLLAVWFLKSIVKYVNKAVKLIPATKVNTLNILIYNLTRSQALIETTSLFRSLIINTKESPSGNTRQVVSCDCGLKLRGGLVLYFFSTMQYIQLNFVLNRFNYKKKSRVWSIKKEEILPRKYTEEQY